MRIAFILLGLVGLCTGCALNRPRATSKEGGNYCEPALVYQYNERYRPLAVIPADTSLTNHLSAHDLQLANAAGLIPLLQALARLPQRSSLQHQVDRATIHQQIQYRLLQVSTEIASLAAELDCEGERADQLGTYLDQRDQKRIRNLTLLSVVIGAATTVTTAFIQTDGLDKTVGIGGGLVSAGLGGAAALSSNKAVDFGHERNLLADIWQPTNRSTTYSPFIWYVLNEKSFSNTQQTSIRANIQSRWQRYILPNATAEQQQLFFGKGGRYQADDLHTRANMLNQLQASVRSINQDLQSLLSYIVR